MLGLLRVMVMNDHVYCMMVVTLYLLTFFLLGNPTPKPSWLPTNLPTFFPSMVPTLLNPTYPPTCNPTVAPTVTPTLQPTYLPGNPSPQPTTSPTISPTVVPTLFPTYAAMQPTPVPSTQPFNLPDLDQMTISGKASMRTVLTCYRTSYSYTGPTFRIRRYNDSVIADFYTDKLGNLGLAINATGTSLHDWLNGWTAYIVIWYLISLDFLL